MRATPRNTSAPRQRRISVEIRPGAVNESQPGASKVRGTATMSVVGMGKARIRVGDAVWLRDKAHPERVFSRGTLFSVAQGELCSVEMAASEGSAPGELLQRHGSELYPANSAADGAPDDHSALVNLNEPCILDSTARRYAADQIYTNTGRILIAVNPFRQLDIYGAATIAAHSDPHARPPPHVFGVAERAYRALRSARQDQVLAMCIAFCIASWHCCIAHIHSIAHSIALHIALHIAPHLGTRRSSCRARAGPARRRQPSTPYSTWWRVRRAAVRRVSCARSRLRSSSQPT